MPIVPSSHRLPLTLATSCRSACEPHFSMPRATRSGDKNPPSIETLLSACILPHINSTERFNFVLWYRCAERAQSYRTSKRKLGRRLQRLHRRARLRAVTLSGTSALLSNKRNRSKVYKLASKVQRPAHGGVRIYPAHTHECACAHLIGEWHRGRRCGDGREAQGGARSNLCPT